MRGTSISAAAAGLLRREALQNPITATLAITQAIMQPIRALLPKFDLIEMSTIPSPVYGTRRAVVGILRLELGKAGFERGARRHYRTLPRSQRRDAACMRTRGE